MPRSPRPPLSGDRKKESLKRDGSRGTSLQDSSTLVVVCPTCGDSSYLPIILDRVQALSCGCSGIRLTYPGV
jgi:hypothetical protein